MKWEIVLKFVAFLKIPELYGITFATGQSEGLLVFIGDAVLGNLALVTKVSGEADQIEVLLNVVHDFGLEESLCGIVHDFVAELGFGNIFAQLLDTGSLGCRSVLVDNFVAFTFGSLLEKSFNAVFRRENFCSHSCAPIVDLHTHRKSILPAKKDENLSNQRGQLKRSKFVKRAKK